MNKKEYIFIVGALLILVGAGYIFFQQQPSQLQSLKLRKLQNDVVKNCKYEVSYCKYRVNSIIALFKGRSMTFKSVYNNGTKTKMTLKFDGKGNSESITYGSDGSTIKRHSIGLNGVTYNKDLSKNTWLKSPLLKVEWGIEGAASNSNLERLRNELIGSENMIKNSFVVKKVGEEACGNLTCTILEVREDSMNRTSKIWVDTSEFLERKSIRLSENGTTTTIQDYKPITISQPAPLQKTQ